MRSSRIVASFALVAIFTHVVLLAWHVQGIARRGPVEAGASVIAFAAPICGAFRTDAPAPDHVPSGAAFDCAVCAGAVAQSFTDPGRMAAPVRRAKIGGADYGAPARVGDTSAAPRDTRSRGPPAWRPAAMA